MFNKALVFGLVICSITLMAASCNSKNVMPVGDNGSSPSSVTQETPAPGSVNVEEKVVNQNQTVIVKYTGSGFSPSTITINAGDTVKFENTSSSSVWPAANPHPIHTSVPGFDAKKALVNGNSYSFTFTKTGTLGYHNHLSPGQTGTIIVK